ncbi:hypothetical protein Leryth_009162 [Lithospermum erythrorhizon]|uniref:RRM domain-containing protein n=1 Tax=Lithospermum erythrorhizon TaxID=34254 RepID=A0AAV3PDM6_LITER|nr:hypothetical protein Leryth_009162 [Lithospermum erythrorhizon]
MSTKPFIMSMDEFKCFHSIDRSLYSILVNELVRDPIEAIQIMALWIWLEKAGFKNVVFKIMPLPHILINELADEAVTCLKCINDTQFCSMVLGGEITLTQNFMKEDISLQFFQDYRVDALRGIAKVLNEVCLNALTDIMNISLKRNVTPPLVQGQMVMPPSNQPFQQNPNQIIKVGQYSHSRPQVNEISPENRTMFVTFSKGYPVTEYEVREFFTKFFGDCIESLYMQDVKADEQALFAKIVFNNPLFLDIVLKGMSKAKFNINGKHVWMRKFVPKNVDVNPSNNSPLPINNLPK